MKISNKQNYQYYTYSVRGGPVVPALHSAASNSGGIIEHLVKNDTLGFTLNIYIYFYKRHQFVYFPLHLNFVFCLGAK